MARAATGGSRIGRTTLTAVLCIASLGPSLAPARPARTVTMPVLGMTGWRADPMTVETGTLGMTGWRTEDRVVDTPVLGMTGWRSGDRVIDSTAVLGMTGWRSGAVRVRR